MTGRLIAVVGPSGVGKDSVIAGIVAARPEVLPVERWITRAPGLGGEEYRACTEAVFKAQRAQGAFCLSWAAHGLYYGIPRSVLSSVATGTERIVNLSRTVLDDAFTLFPRLIVLNLTARPETLAARVADRGRESVADIRQRLDRRVGGLAPHLPVHTISNDAALDETVAQACAVLDAATRQKERME